MDSPWSKIWFVIALMLAVALWALLASISKEGGTLAEWFAGATTLLAVVVALKASHDQGALALKLANAERKARVDAALEADHRLLKALLVVLCNAAQTLRHQWNAARQNPITGPRLIKAVLDSSLFTVVTDSLEQVKIDQMPSTASVDVLMSAKAAWALAKDQLQSFASGGAMPVDLRPVDRLDDMIVLLADELVSHGGGVGAAEDPLVERAINQALARADKSPEPRHA